MTHGVLYYLGDQTYGRCLRVSVASLRRWYDGPVCIASTRGGWKTSEEIAGECGAEVIHAGAMSQVSPHNVHFKNKCSAYMASPFDRTVYIDADTVVVGEIDDLFDAVPFVTQWGDRTLKSGEAVHTRGRLSELARMGGFYPALVNEAIETAPLINCGVLGFERQSPMLREMSHLAMWMAKFGWCDQTAMQVLIPIYRPTVMPEKWNWITKFNHPCEDVRIMHFLGGRWKGTADWKAVEAELIGAVHA